MRARWLIATLLGCSVCSSAQLSGRLYLDKDSYAPGEPIFLRFEVKNEGTAAQTIIQADPYSFCSGYQVKLRPDPDTKSDCSGFGFGGNCLSSSRPLAAGEKYIESILLNYEHHIESAGEYDVDASRSLTDGYDYSPVLEVRVHLHFRIDPNAQAPTAQLQHWINQLHSKNALQKQGAARVLASLGPISLEDVLLGFANDPDLVRWAPLAFSRLHTERGLAGLAELVRTAQPGSAEHLQSAEYLGKTGDSKWFPLLAEVARKKGQISNYVAYAAQTGGDKALPLLLELLQSPDKTFTQLNAAMALGDTGSRDAVPILLSLLKNPNSDLTDRAVYSLRQLTHRTYGDGQGHLGSDQVSAWLQWWNREGSTARIYKAGECGELVPLN